MSIIAIDPGNEESALVEWDGSLIIRHEKIKNEDLFRSILLPMPKAVVCEMIQGYGMSVGQEVFETCVMVGRLWMLCALNGVPFHRLTRKVIKAHLCSVTTAKDKDIRAALIGRFGDPGKKATPGVLYGIAGDEWAALAVAVTWWDQQNGTVSVPAELNRGKLAGFLP